MFLGGEWSLHFPSPEQDPGFTSDGQRLVGIPAKRQAATIASR